MKQLVSLDDYINKSNSKLIRIFIVSSFIIAFLILLYRSQFGFDWSDEGYYAALSYRFTLGDKLFVDSWDIHQTSAILISPIIWCYMKLTGSTGGIILFLRIMFLVVKLTVSVYIYNSIKKVVNKLSGFVTAMIFLLFTPFNIGTLSYNNLSLMLNICCTMSIINLMNSRNEKEKMIYPFATGILLSLCIISYPTYLVCLPLYFILIIYMEIVSKDTKKTKVKVLTWFFLGLSIVVLMFGIYVIAKVGIRPLLDNIKQLFGEEDHVKSSLIMQIKTFFNEIYIYTGYKKLIVFLFLILASLSMLKIKKSETLKIYIPSIFLTVVILVNAAYYFNSSESSYRAHIFVFSIGIWELLVLALARSSEIARLTLIIWLPSFFGSLSIFLGTNNGIRGAAYSFIGCTIAIILSMFMVSKKSNNNFKIIKLLGIVQGFVIIVILIISNYNYVYRDSRIGGLNTKLQVGPYSHIYTTKENAKVYEGLYDDLRKATNGHEYATVVQCMPFAYMCIDSKVASHTVWWVHPESNRLNSYIEKNISRKPSVIILIDENIGVHNDNLNANTSFVLDYINRNKQSVTQYRYFKAYYLKQ